jgi:site-specific recombinase XerD
MEATKMPKTNQFRYDEALLREISLRGLSYKSYKNYRSRLRLLSEHFSKDVADITPEEMKSYLLEIKHRGLSAQTMNLSRAAYIFCKRQVLGQDISPDSVPMHKVIPKLPDILPPETIVSALRETPLKYRAIFSLCYGSGFRISEAAGVRIEDIDSRRMSVRCVGKGGKSRYSILSAYSLGILREYYAAFRPKGPYLFPNKTDPGKPCSTGYAFGIFRAAIRRAFPENKRRITIHTLRHCFATHLLDSGVDLRTIQVLLGHTAIQSTCIYTQLTNAHFAKIVSPLDREGM